MQIGDYIAIGKRSDQFIYTKRAQQAMRLEDEEAVARRDAARKENPSARLPSGREPQRYVYLLARHYALPRPPRQTGSDERPLVYYLGHSTNGFRLNREYTSPAFGAIENDKKPKRASRPTPLWSDNLSPWHGLRMKSGRHSRTASTPILVAPTAFQH